MVCIGHTMEGSQEMCHTTKRDALPSTIARHCFSFFAFYINAPALQHATRRVDDKSNRHQAYWCCSVKPAFERQRILKAAPNVLAARSRPEMKRTPCTPLEASAVSAV